MIGNDVVDLALSRIESNWQRYGISNKIFTRNEQELIDSATDSETMYWTFWSRKEAVYKIIARAQNIRKFIPLQIECQTIDAMSIVIYNNVNYYVNTKIEYDLIHSVAVAKYYDLQNVIELKDCCEITKEGVYPFAICNGIVYPISVSHHGEFRKVVKLDPT